jgi:hypothetical protein
MSSCLVGARQQRRMGVWSVGSELEGMQKEAVLLSRHLTEDFNYIATCRAIAK